MPEGLNKMGWFGLGKKKSISLVNMELSALKEELNSNKKDVVYDKKILNENELLHKQINKLVVDIIEVLQNLEKSASEYDAMASGNKEVRKSFYEKIKHQLHKLDDLMHSKSALETKLAYLMKKEIKVFSEELNSEIEILRKGDFKKISLTLEKEFGSKVKSEGVDSRSKHLLEQYGG